MKRMLVNLGAEAIINMSQDIVADQLENDKYPSVKALFDVEGSDFGMAEENAAADASTKADAAEANAIAAAAADASTKADAAEANASSGSG
jgi:hypothetical protein